MSLNISEKNGTFYLNGNINTTTSRFFIIQIEHSIQKYRNVVINIDNVNEIDRDGLAAINTLRAIALRNHKVFSILGYGCKEIYDHFNQNLVA